GVAAGVSRGRLAERFPALSHRYPQLRWAGAGAVVDQSGGHAGDYEPDWALRDLAAGPPALHPRACARGSRADGALRAQGLGAWADRRDAVASVTGGVLVCACDGDLDEARQERDAGVRACKSPGHLIIQTRQDRAVTPTRGGHLPHNIVMNYSV